MPRKLSSPVAAFPGLGMVSRPGDLERRSGPQLLKNGHLASRRRQGFEVYVDLVAGMLAGHDATDAGFAFGDGREGDAGGHDTFFK